MGGVQVPASQPGVHTGLWAACGRIVCWRARPKRRGCVMAGQGLCYLFWVCALGAHTDSTGPDSYNPSSQLSIQSILITTAVPQLSSSLVAFLAWSLASPPGCQATLVLPWQWQVCSALPCIRSILLKLGQDSVRVVPGSRPWTRLSSWALQLYFGWQLKTAGTEKRARAPQCKSSVPPARNKTPSFCADPPRTWCAGGTALWWDSFIQRHCFPQPKFVLNFSCPITFLPMASLDWKASVWFWFCNKIDNFCSSVLWWLLVESWFPELILLSHNVLLLTQCQSRGKGLYFSQSLVSGWLGSEALRMLLSCV